MNVRRTALQLAVVAAIPALVLSANAKAGCTISADNLTTNCTGTLTAPISVYDAAAAYQPIAGSNSYTPANPTFLARNYPATPGYNPSPATVTVNLDPTAIFNFVGTSASGGGLNGDKGLIAANYSNSESIAGSGVNNWTVNNAGSVGITATGQSGGRLSAFVSDSQVNVFTVNNAATGNINATQSINISASPATDYQLSFSAPKLSYAATDGASTKAIVVISGIYTDDNTNAASISNKGKISAQGSFSAAYYGRADTTIANTGTIQNTSWTNTGAGNDLLTNNGTGGHWAIASWAGTGYAALAGSNPDTPVNIATGSGTIVKLPTFSTISGSAGGMLTSFGNIQTIYNVAVADTNGLSITNSGTIKGDVLAIDITPTFWAAAQAQNINPSFIAGSGTSSGPRDSNVLNSGTISGNVFLGSGTHNWNNSGTINGNINVDQGGGIATFSVLATAPPPANYLYTTAGATTTNSAGAACAASGGTNDPFCALTTKVLGAFVGGQTFNLTNSGAINGNLNIANLMSTSKVTFSPTITGSGIGSSQSSPSNQINGINGALNVTNASLSTTPLLALGYSAGNASNVSLSPVIQSGITVTNGAWYQVANAISGNVLSSAALPVIQQPSSGLISWTDSINNAGSLVLGATINANSASIPGMSVAGGNALKTLLQFNSAAGNAIESLATAAAVRQAAEQLRPEINGATTQSALRITDKVFDLIDLHLAEKNLAQLKGKSDIASNEQANGNGVWMSVFGFHGDQNTRQNVDGYTTDAAGFVLGSDKMIDGTTRLGGAISYGSTDIDDKGTNLGSHTNIVSYLATAYGSKVYDGWYLNGVLGLGRHAIDSNRDVLSNAVLGSHNALQYSARVDAGMPVNVGPVTVTPVASLTYGRLNQNAYTERGVGALMVNKASVNSLRSGLGATALVPIKGSDVNANMQFHAIWNHDFANTTQDTTASFIGGNGNTFTANGLSPARESLDLGTSLILFGTEKGLKQTLLLRYDVELKDKYLNQMVLLQANFDF